MILFNDSGHVYTRKADGVRYLSNSGLMGRYEPEFMGLHWKKVGSLKELVVDYDKLKDNWHDLGNHMLSPDYVKYLESFIDTDEQRDAYEMFESALDEEWANKRDNAAFEGTKTHGQLEDLAYDLGFVIDVKYRYEVFPRERVSGKNWAIVDDLQNLPTGAHPELVVFVTFPKDVYDDVLDCMIGGIAGQVDLPLLRVSNGRKIARIKDYKTNEKLDDFSYKWPNHGYLTWKFPVDEIRDSKLGKYTMQMSMYGLMLDLSGWHIEDLEIIHNGKHIKVPYIREQALSMLRHFYYTKSGDASWLRRAGEGYLSNQG